MPRKAADKPATKKTATKTTRKKKTDVVAEAVAETTPIVETAASEAPVEPTAPALKKRGRKPKAAAETVADAPTKKTRKPRKPKEKKPELVLTTTLQLGDKEFDISGIAEKAYKEYKRVHKRKVVTDFHIYVKPEEGAAYFTINGEGSEDFKVEL